MMVSWNGDPQFSSIYRWWSFRETIQRFWGRSSHAANLTGGWANLPLWKIRRIVSWDYEIPNWMESHKIQWCQSPPSSYNY